MKDHIECEVMGGREERSSGRVFVLMPIGCHELWFGSGVHRDDQCKVHTTRMNHLLFIIIEPKSSREKQNTSSYKL
jgi:hypothetical protein